MSTSGTVLVAERGRYDVVVVGGGPAGLQAALTLGRLHRSVLVVDSGEYRNAPARHLQNFVTHDGRPPAEWRAAARADLASYDTVTVHEDTVLWVKVEGEDDVRLELAGGAVVGARKVVLATGLRDTLPDKPGLRELFGTVAAHCPYCHGHEMTGEHVAVLGSGPHVGRLPLMLERIAARITVLTDGGRLDEATAALLSRNGVTVDPRPVRALDATADGADVVLDDGERLPVGGIFVAPELSQAAPFAEDLGLALLPSGCVEVDVFGRTSVPAVRAAGDLAHTAAVPMPMASVLTAAAAGMMAATGIEQDLLVLDHGLAKVA